MKTSFNNFLLENNINNYNKFPLSALVKQAKLFDIYKEFSNHYSLDIFHGYYWHLTDNPNFKISDKISPRDMSSMTNGGNLDNGGDIMVTSDLEYWDEHYNTNREWKRDVKRNYVVLFDASNIEPKYLKQVNRGFGNEVYLHKNEANKLIQIGVYNLKYAKSLDKKYHNMIPQSEKELYDIWKFANSKVI